MNQDLMRTKVGPLARWAFSFASLFGALVGCRALPDRASKSMRAGTPIAAADSRPVPLPSATPFDHDGKLRQAYLDSFARAYVLAASGSDYAGLGCLCEAGGDEKAYDALTSGFFAGKKAGELALASSVVAKPTGDPLAR